MPGYQSIGVYREDGIWLIVHSGLSRDMRDVGPGVAEIDLDGPVSGVVFPVRVRASSFDLLCAFGKEGA